MSGVWVQPDLRDRIVDFYPSHPDDGYRRVTDLMMDAGMVAASPSSVYRVLSQAGALRRWEAKPSKKGKGFVPPPSAHAHCHIDVSYLNLSGTFYYLCSILDGYSRSIDHYEIREQMTEQDVEIIVQRALEAFPEARPRIISDNSSARLADHGPQFVAKDFSKLAWIVSPSRLREPPERLSTNILSVGSSKTAMPPKGTLSSFIRAFTSTPGATKPSSEIRVSLALATRISHAAA